MILVGGKKNAIDTCCAIKLSNRLETDRQTDRSVASIYENERQTDIVKLTTRTRQDNSARMSLHLSDTPEWKRLQEKLVTGQKFSGFKALTSWKILFLFIDRN